jgi:NAD-dependent DNA ligase
LDLISLNERLIGVVGSETADALGFEAAAEELFALQTELDDITGTFGKFNEETGRFAMIGGEGFMDSAGFALNRIVLGSTGAMGEAADEAAVLTQQINDLLASNEDFANFIESEGIDNIDEFVEALLQNDKALDNLQKTINGSEGSMGGFNSEIENSIQLFDEFNNAREELFFGFKAGNITGDLVKQIEQKGVENFVANTEIIMTNNFNGMTTDQVADEILRKINERAVTNGINVSPA